MNEKHLRQEIIDKCMHMNAIGLNQGTSGNISARHHDVMLITPSAIPYADMKPDMIASMPLDRSDGHYNGPLKPSVEWRFHLDILKSRRDVNAVVHTHSTFATVLAITGRDIPAVHYMIAAFGGDTVRCAPYGRYGTRELSDNALEALEGRNGCLLANHGMIAAGPSLSRTMWLAEELELLSKQYFHALQIGNPVILSKEEISGVGENFKTYGLQDKRDG